jgi:hypothetical protein
MSSGDSFDVARPNIARVYDYLLGGKDNLAADRQVGDAIIASLPAVQVGVRALLADNTSTVVAAGDLRDPAGILADPAVSGHIDWSRPAGLLLCGILHHLLDDEDPAGLVATLTGALPAGSYVFIHHLLDSGDPAVAGVQATFQQALGRGQFRGWDQIRDMFAGLDLVEPGLVLVPEWRPEPGTPGVREHPVLQLAAAGVARKP